MLCFSTLRLTGLTPIAFAACAAILLSACTVEPLNASRTNTALSSSTQSVLASTSVSPVSTREAQQVRNALLFAMNGGSLQPNGQYRVDLIVSPVNYNLSVQVDSLAPTSAQLSITASYKLINLSNGETAAKGTRTAVASYDKTAQSFANERAQRDAENRAAKEVAQQLRLSIAQSLSAT